MSTLLLYRDDGPLARALARLGRGLPPSLLATLAVLPVLAVLAATGASHSRGLLAAVVAWLVLLGGASRGGALGTDRFRWAVPPLLRAGEYATLLWLGAACHRVAPAFALLVVLAFRHYDLVYRPRYQRRPPAPGVGAAALGWDGRLVAGWILLALDILPAGFYAAAGILGALFVAESVASWRRQGRDLAPALDDDTEGDAG
jgi:uncharacterized SAM-binding protein YcdF (DUF218 family)